MQLQYYYKHVLHTTSSCYQYFNQESVRASVCTDLTHFRNVYSGNEATTYTVTRTLGTSLLTVGAERATATVTGGLRRRDRRH